MALRVCWMLLCAVLILPAAAAGEGDFTWPEGRRAAVSLAYDDSLPTHLDVAIPALDRYGLKGSFYLTLAAGLVRERMADWRAAADSGHELGNHSLFHQCSARGPEREWVQPEQDLDAVTVAQMRAQVLLGNAMLQAIDGSTEHTFTAPCGDLMARDGNYIQALDGLFLGIKLVGAAVVPDMASFDPAAVPVVAPVGLGGAEMIALVEEAGRLGTMVNFTFHGIGGDHLETSREAHDELLAYLHANRDVYWTDTFRNQMRWVRAQQTAGEAVAAAKLAHDRAVAGPSEVRIVQEDGAYRLLVNGEPFHVLGAGLSGGDQDELARRGGNSFRTWSTGTDREAVLAMLDRAQRNGLMVAMGIHVEKERHGFDYDDAQAVAAQRERIRAEVALYRDHPAVLMWVVGNELNLEASNPAVWDAVNDIALAIHEVDPLHPVMTALAGFDAALIGQIKARAPALDLLGIQVYGDIGGVSERLLESGWSGPYMLTEWGPTGHWESPETDWGAPIEDDASTKAGLRAERYLRDIASDRTRSLGSYVFLWGQKQERTPTWYGLFLPSGETTPGVDAMQHAWTGAWPENRAPSVSPLRIDGRDATESVTLRPGQVHEARVSARDADSDPLGYRWTLREESTATSIGGDPEALPPEVALQVEREEDGVLRFAAPERPGAYRLFVEVRDGQGHAAYANFPFRVESGDGP